MDKIFCKCGCGELLPAPVGKRHFVNAKHRDVYYNHKKGLRKTDGRTEIMIFGLPCRNDVMSMECADRSYFQFSKTANNRGKVNSKRRKAS